MQKNPVCFWELASNDAEASVNFLKNVFDWDIEFDGETGIYRVPADQSPGSFNGGGIFTLKKAKLPFLTVYIRVDDIDSKVELVEKHGGYVVGPPSDLPDGSRICLFNEPSGVTLAMIQRPSQK